MLIPKVVRYQTALCPEKDTKKIRKRDGVAFYEEQGQKIFIFLICDESKKMNGDIGACLPIVGNIWNYLRQKTANT
ncbi:MAG TPA: hypothetical protein DD435_13555 [Cyanobacteria bacterium UBA8530]|nr:hypothetical protein [Cyanobacteria bacterium UBA8530]